MPKIRWTGLPPALRDHLFERLRERKITAEDLYQSKLWRESEPEAPDGLWYKDFGSFRSVARGSTRRPSSSPGNRRTVKRSEPSSFSAGAAPLSAAPAIRVETARCCWSDAATLYSKYPLTSRSRWTLPLA